MTLKGGLVLALPLCFLTWHADAAEAMKTLTPRPP